MRPGFRLLVFDWDGTLMDSEARIVSCMDAAIADLGLAPLPRERVRDIIGLGLREALERLLPGQDETHCAHLVERYRHHYLNGEIPELFAGVADTLHRLHARGLLLAVATGKGRHGLDKVLDATGLRHLFAASRCADETFSKPHPRMLLELMEETGVERQQALMIGDTEFDMEMANRAGVGPVAVCCGVHPRERLMAHQPLVCLADITGLPEWLDRAHGLSSAGSEPGIREGALQNLSER